MSLKAEFTCTQCGNIWKGKSMAERKVPPRCPKCASRIIQPSGAEQPSTTVDLRTVEVIPDDHLQQIVLEPVEFDVEIQPLDDRKKAEPILTKKQIDQLVKASRHSMRELCGMGYTGLIMIMNFIFKFQMPPPTPDEVNRFAEAWLSITRTQRTFGKTMKRIPILGMVAIHFDFFFRRRAFFKPPAPKVTTKLTDTSPEEPIVVPIEKGSPFTAQFDRIE